MLQHVIPKAPNDEIERRRAMCRACEHRGELPLVRVEVCKVCGCPIQNKTQIQSSSCPKGKW